MQNDIRRIPSERKRWFINNNRETLRNHDAAISDPTRRARCGNHNDSPISMCEFMHGMAPSGEWI
jgi:hypothetical protein